MSGWMETSETAISVALDGSKMELAYELTKEHAFLKQSRKFKRQATIDFISHHLKAEKIDSLGLFVL